MSKPVIAVCMLGRFGNTMFQYAYAKAYAERYDCQFQCDPGWIGYKIFQLQDQPISDPNLPRRTEITATPGESNICFHTYAMQQKCVLYSTAKLREWFKFRPEILEISHSHAVPMIAAHRRVGDMSGYGYPICSLASYGNAAYKLGYNPSDQVFVTEEDPATDPRSDSWAPFLPDFLRLTLAPVIFRGNSSFSWWAAAIGYHRKIYSPIINGLVGGVAEHDVEFVEGNWPRLSDHDFVSDMHVPEI